MNAKHAISLNKNEQLETITTDNTFTIRQSKRGKGNKWQTQEVTIDFITHAQLISVDLQIWAEDCIKSEERQRSLEHAVHKQS